MVLVDGGGRERKEREKVKLSHIAKRGPKARFPPYTALRCKLCFERAGGRVGSRALILHGRDRRLQVHASRKVNFTKSTKSGTAVLWYDGLSSFFHGLLELAAGCWLPWERSAQVRASRKVNFTKSTTSETTVFSYGGLSNLFHGPVESKQA